MKVSKAIKICLDYHRNHSKPNTIRSYEAILTKFGLIFGDKDLEEISPNCQGIFSGRRNFLFNTSFTHIFHGLQFIFAHMVIVNLFAKNN